MPVGLALLGSGIFAREAHLPAIAQCDDFQLKAIYSRSLKSAKDLHAETQKLLKNASDISLYCDENGPSLEELLKRDDIKAVVIALPITVQPQVIAKCLDAGKFCLSEKPIAKDIATAERMIARYGFTGRWFIAENFCHEDAIHIAQEWVQSGRLGKIRTFQFYTTFLVAADGKYAQTSWRKVPDYQGGFILDGGVHNTAMLRQIFQQNLHVKACLVDAFQGHLPPCDTVQALLRLEDGTSGVFFQSVGTESFPSTSPPMLSIFGSEGSLEFTQGHGPQGRQFSVRINSLERGARPVEEFSSPSNGVVREIAKYGKVVSGQASPDTLKDVLPERALQDLRVIEEMLNAGKQK